jgi:hypothetical protein
VAEGPGDGGLIGEPGGGALGVGTRPLVSLSAGVGAGGGGVSGAAGAVVVTVSVTVSVTVEGTVASRTSSPLGVAAMTRMARAACRRVGGFLAWCCLGRATWW